MPTRISDNVAQIIELSLSEKVQDGDVLEWDVSPVEHQVAWYPYVEQSVSIWVLLRENDGFSIDTKVFVPMLEISDERIKSEVDRIWDAFIVERLEWSLKTK